jgi:hypothetical protein
MLVDVIFKGLEFHCGNRRVCFKINGKPWSLRIPRNNQR